MRSRFFLAACGLLFGSLASAGGDTLFGGHTASFEDVYFIPQSDEEAARFLTQATFGPSRASIQQFRGNSYSNWIDGQMTQAATLARPHLQGLTTIDQNRRMDRWFHTAAMAPDQLRQRMAFALSQILVISDRSDALSNDALGVAEYWDILLRNAFGNYRTLLTEVTKSPMMGRYLSHWRNRKATPVNATTPISPDENYAREIMQLFTIGLVERERDFSPVLAGGFPIPTYDQTDITELARVFTGWSYACSAGQTEAQCNRYSGINSGPASFVPMACFPSYMDYEAKTIVGNTPIAAAPNAAVCGVTNGAQTTNTTIPSDPLVQAACHQYCIDQIDQAIDTLFNHPNTAPFVSRQLIQRFITSNPSPAYIDRVAAVFEDNGSGQRGDLGAVIRAILMDVEAREPPLDPAAPYGKMREPLLRLTALWRAFGVTAPNSGVEFFMGLRSPQDSYAQRPLGASTVFNFYEPDYQPPGVLGLTVPYAPEFQIANETTVVTSANNLWDRTFAGYSTSSGIFTAPNDRAWLVVSDLVPLVSGANAVGTTAYDNFLQELNIRLFYGTLTTGTRDELKNFLRFGLAGAPDNVKILSTLHLAVLSPDFQIQR